MTDNPTMIEKLAVGLVQKGRAKAAQDLVSLAHNLAYLDAAEADYIRREVRQEHRSYKARKQVICEIQQAVDAERAGRAAMDKATR